MRKKYYISYQKGKKYSMFGGMNNMLASIFISEISTIYSQIVSLYSHGDIIVLSGSCALLYYLHSFGFTDLLDEFDEPNDVIFLLLTSDKNSIISVPFIGDHKKQITYVKSATFSNDWASHLKIKTFDLIIARNSISYNKVGKINLITLNQLKSYYSNNLDLRTKNIKKIQIIEQIQLRLIDNPHIK
jgi:hypothetical protein